ncbi:MAG: peptidylprolyl isomerase [Sandaracinus sp.]
MRTTVLLCLALGVSVVAGGCGGDDEPHFHTRASAQDRGRGHGRPPHASTADEAPPPTTRVVPPPSAVGPTVPVPPDPRLANPSALTARAPETFAVELTTTAGTIVIDVTRAWSPNGADRFYNLVQNGFFTDVAFFRVIQGFMAQGGIHGDPATARAWQSARIPDDSAAGQHNTRGMVSFAMAGPNSRTTQFFINLVDNSRLDPMGFTPFGRVRDMTAVDALYAGYGESAPAGHGPLQGRIQSEGNAYLRAEFPSLSYIVSARVL